MAFKPYGVAINFEAITIFQFYAFNIFMDSKPELIVLKLASHNIIL